MPPQSGPLGVRVVIWEKVIVRKVGDLLIQEESGHEVELILRTLSVLACLLRDLLP